MSKRLNKRQMRELEELEALKASTPVQEESEEEEEQEEASAPAFNPFAAVSCALVTRKLTPARRG